MKKLFLAGSLSFLMIACSNPDSAIESTKISSQTPSDFAAHWFNEELFLIGSAQNAVSFELVSSATASLDNGEAPDLIVPLQNIPRPDYIQGSAPHLSEFIALKPNTALENVQQLLKNQLAILQKDSDGNIQKVSYLQTARVLDALYTAADNDADEVDGYGATLREEKSRFLLWAPTAISVSVKLYDEVKEPLASIAMTEDESGVWQANSEFGQGTYYRYEVEVYHPRTQNIEKLEVTDPYSLSLSRNSKFSQVVDLSSEATKPLNWDKQKDSLLTHPESLILYETHIRDFSASDNNLSDIAHAGKYKAFSEVNSDGMKHLLQLGQAGLNTVHLLPTYDISTVNEDPDKVIFPQDDLNKVCSIVPSLEFCDQEIGQGIDKSQSLQTLLESYDVSGTQAQNVIEQIRAFDPYNWGYDPYHYTVPEGSYALDPEGIPRLVEFREMVQSLHNKGFRVIMDVVYNHTFASGLDEKSVLDKVVPNYYQRLNPISGEVETSTCCDNTATENRMMAKLMIDSLVIWANHYKIDGFRFDLMGHQPKAAMLEAREAVRAVDPDTYFYGEGWNFGEVANNAQFEQAAQLPLAGTEIGTFTDRLRDAVRGGSSFVSGDDIRFGQGIGNGLSILPNELQVADNQLAEKEDAQQAEYSVSMDQVRVGLAGNLAEFPLQDASGADVLGKDVLYGNAPTGYALDPADTINYVSKHDNQTLWDNNQYRFAFATTTNQRVRMQNLSLAYPLFAQGIPFLHMGSELLRSKSFLRDSYDYGDWFNVVDFAKQGNNYNVGLPPSVKDEANWDVISRIIKGNESRDHVKPAHIEFASNVFMDFISIRSSTPLFSLKTAEQVIERVKFHNTGKEQQQGLIVMSIADGEGVKDLDAAFDSLVVIFNNNLEAKEFSYEGAENYSLHPVQANGADPIVASASALNGQFNVPALSVAVFVN